MNGKKHIRISDVIKDRSFAINLFASAVCNLNCKYCYIPKNKTTTSNIQEKIINNIESGSYVNTIEEWFDIDRVIAISHWGAEPTLTLLRFICFYETAFNKFKNLTKKK